MRRLRALQAKEGSPRACLQRVRGQGRATRARLQRGVLQVSLPTDLIPNLGYVASCMLKKEDEVVFLNAKEMNDKLGHCRG